MNNSVNMKLDKDMVRVVSYLTFDGHLTEDLSNFYLSSKNIKTLKEFENIVKRKFLIIGRFEEGNGFGLCYKYRVFNSSICRLLLEIGTPNGNKMIKEFSIPSWIKKNKELSREYLRIAFYCEGGFWFEKEIPKIRFGICKSKDKLENGVRFSKEMKLLLKRFKIDTTNIWIVDVGKGKRGIETKQIFFKIKSNSIYRFAKEIGFGDIDKNKRLLMGLAN